MSRSFGFDRARRVAAAAVVLASFAGASPASAETTGRFAGSKANTGSATFDARGTVYPLERLPIKGDAVNRSIELPAYVPDVAKVQIWCAFAETLLGEAQFAAPVK